MRILMPEMTFEGTATWKGATECELSIKGNKLVTVSPPHHLEKKKATAYLRTYSQQL